MATVTLRIEDLVRDRLQDIAESRGISLSDLIRLAIDDLFDPDNRGEPRLNVVPESMTAIDRKQLALLHRILARSVEGEPDDDRLGHDGVASYQLDRAQALEEGWAREYDMEFYAMETELSRPSFILKYSAEEVADELTADELRPLAFRGLT